jgi:hypothetical protein
MVNPNLVKLAERTGNIVLDREETIKPEDYAVPKDDFYAHLSSRDVAHPDRVGEALSLIRNAYQELGSNHDLSGLVVVAVGSSLQHTNYNDIDVALVGIKTPESGNKLFRKVNGSINGSEEKQDNGLRQFYSGIGPSTSDFRSSRDYLVDLILDETGKSFDEWHRMMVATNQGYCILDRNVGDCLE